MIRKYIAYERAHPLGLGTEGIPLVRGWPRKDFPKGGQLVVCPFECKKGYHLHGIGEGHRISHCHNQPDSDRGYIISRCASPKEIEEALK